ncbi:MAG: type I secretion system permease/ATPase [Amaricoccus sp.]
MAQPSTTTPEFREAMRDLLQGAAAAAFVGLFVNVMYLALPLYTNQIYDRVISSGSMDTLMALTLIVAIVLVFQAALDYLRHRIFVILGGRVASRLGRPVFEAAVESTLRHGAGPASGAIRDLGDVRTFIASGAVALPTDILITPLFLVVLFLLHPLYGMVGLAGAALLLVTGVTTELAVRRPTARTQQANSSIQAETAAAIRNAEVIVAMGMLPAVARRWRRTQAQALDSVERGRAVAKALTAAAKGLRTGLQIANVCAGAWLVIHHEVSSGSIVAASVLSSRLLLPYEQLIDGWRQWCDALAAIDRIRDVLTRGATTRSGTPVAVQRAVLVADRVGYVPAGQAVPLIRNVSFKVEGGELLGIVGPSGAGKSTLARLIVGLWAPTSGGLYLDGHSTFGHERGSFGEAVGYLPQDPALLDGRVRENIARFRDADMADVVAAARLAGIHEMIGRLPQGYETRLTDAASRLSGGQKQRLALARALFGDPKLVVMDEPNSSLDGEGEAALMEAMEIARARGAAVVVVAQRMSILNRATRLLVLRDGAVAHFGPRAEVLAALSPARKGGRVEALPLREASR